MGTSSVRSRLSRRGSHRESQNETLSVRPDKSFTSSKISVGALSLGEVFDGSILDEDLTIAQNLLAGSEFPVSTRLLHTRRSNCCYHIKDPILILPPDPPIIPPRRSSFGHTSTANARPVLLDVIASSTHSIEANNRRRGYNATSNTWTSSSGEISETDDVDSRATFVEEYNKIANQVCLF